MIARFVRDSIRRAPRRKALIIAAVAMGSAVATSMLGVMLSVGDKVNRELRAVGANIVVTERAASLTGGVGGVTAPTAAGVANYIPESEVPAIKSIFWHLNITGFAPSLSAEDDSVQIQGVWFAHPFHGPDGDRQITGVRAVNPSWDVRGRWAQDLTNECMIGEGVARRSATALPCWARHSR
jgi:putative ABC transport system permease protein